MQRTTLFITVLCLAACDGDTENEDLDARASVIELDASDDRELESEHHGKRHHDPAARLCEAASCSEAQLEQVRAAFAPPHHERPERPDMSEANRALSEAFASEDFERADLETWASHGARPGRGAHHLEIMSELHTIFSPDQRHVVAARAMDGQLFGGRSKRHHRDDDGRHASRAAEHFCGPLDCTDEQAAELAEIFADRADRDATRIALGAAFEAETFDPDAVSELLHPTSAMGASIVSIHGVLNVDQRAQVAERIAEEGPRAVLGKKHGHHGKRPRGKRGRHGKRPCDGRDGHDEGRERDEGPEFG